MRSALTAIRDGAVVAIRYVRDLDPDFDGERLDVRVDEGLPAIADARRRLADIGHVEFGMCSSWEFIGFA